MTPSSATLGWVHQCRTEPPGLVTTLEAPGDLDSEVRWALLADPHISADPSKEYLGARPDARVREAWGQVSAASPEAALIAGDLSWDQGLPEDYRSLRQILDPSRRTFPICLMTGNHDSRGALLAEFGPPALDDLASVERSVIVCDHGPIRWIMLDSLFRTDVVPGLLGENQRRWLSAFLASAEEKVTLLCVHHPLGEQDDRLLDTDRLLQIVCGIRSVKAIFTAHDHVYRIETVADIPVVGMPALGMPFHEGEPTGWLEARFSSRGASLRFHVVGENRRRDGKQTELVWR